eukprot:COSAG01_NODE_348_length_18498_cov_181.563128_16_plen_127_part_00
MRAHAATLANILGGGGSEQPLHLPPSVCGALVSLLHVASARLTAAEEEHELARRSSKFPACALPAGALQRLAQATQAWQQELQQHIGSSSAAAFACQPPPERWLDLAVCVSKLGEEIRIMPHVNTK